MGEADVMVMPKYRHVLDVASFLGCISTIANDAVEEAEHAFILAITIAEQNLPLLRKIREKVDLIAVHAVQSALDQEYRHLQLGRVNLYAPNPIQHRGRMSGNDRSDAKYHWMIEREEPWPGSDPVALLIQELQGETSGHYHLRTHELMFRLAGKAMLKGRKVVTSVESAQTLEQRLLSLLLPETSRLLEQHEPILVPPGVGHKLESQERSYNGLVMYPYDPDLKDHHYLPDGVF